MLASVVLAGLAVGIAFGGDWRRLRTFSLRLWPLLILAAGARGLTVLFPHAPLWVHLASIAGVGVVALANARLPGAALIASGTFLNVAVIALNAGMPYDPTAVAEVGVPMPDDALRTVAGRDTRLPFLGDVIPVGAMRSVYSVGDVLIALGGFLIPFMWVQGSERGSAEQQGLRSSNFALFWLAQVVSRLGDPIMVVALTFVTYRLTESALLTALAVATAIIPYAVFGLFAGALADAVGHRRSMLWCDIVRFGLIVLMPPLLEAGAPLAVIFFLALSVGAAGAMFNPARSALVSDLVSRESFAAANALVHATDRTVEIVGSLAAGILVARLGDGALYLDALTFALSAILLTRVVVREEPRRVGWDELRRDAREGLAFLRQTSVLWANTLFALAAQVSTPIINTLTPVLLVRRFAENDAAAGAVLYGGTEAAIALGAVVGSVVVPRFVRGIRKGTTLVVGLGATGAVIVLIAFAPTYPIAVVLYGALGVANVLFFVPTVTIIQEHTPAKLMGRVFGARYALTSLSWLPLLLLGGYVGELIGIHVLIAVAGTATLVTALLGALSPRVRDVP